MSETPDRLPVSGRLAGIDFGTVRIGVSLSDPSQRFASPLETFNRSSPARESQWILAHVREHDIQGFVVGLPVHTNGRESQKSTEARQFAHWLRVTTQRPVQLFDERFTTVEADSILADARTPRKKRKQRRDMLAAQILLTAFLESSRETDSRSLD